MDQHPVLRPGDLSNMFDGLAERFTKYNVVVHSTKPWVVTFENFVSDVEIDGILSSVEGQFARSTDQGAKSAQGVQEQITSTSRTSENAWCQGKCQIHPSSVAVVKRISEVVGVPVENFEQFQVLSYAPNQYYRTHHDMSGSDNQMPAGPRIYTFFLYFSDVEEGGETNFPELNITVRPKKGSALLWPSVLSENPTAQEPLTHHQAISVRKGHKLAANLWAHLFNYREPNRWGCTGAFA